MVGLEKLKGGLIAAVLAVAVGAPLDVVRTRTLNGEPGYSRGFWAGARKLLQSEGLASLGHGALTKTLRVCLGTTVFLVSFESFLGLLGLQAPPE
jgi:hypothetical protein